jgi:hypothetical protein
MEKVVSVEGTVININQAIRKYEFAKDYYLF